MATEARENAPENIEHGGYDYEFVSKVPDKYGCQICTKVYRNPQMTDCCGQHYCESCLEYWFKKQYGKKSCPHCRKENFNHILNREKQQEIRQLIIHCTHHQEGCQWVGELDSLQTHLNSDSGCSYVEVNCINECGVKEKRKDLNNHLTNNCLLRRYKCPYCSHVDTYLAITCQHCHTCPSYPIPCPYKCGYFKRKDMHAHIEMCLEVEVSCTNRCKEKMKRKHLESHLADSCPLRKYKCQYCSHEDTYQVVVSKHYNECPDYSLPCPNKCGESAIRRKEMGVHIARCPLEQVSCLNGCGKEMKRKDLRSHLADSCPMRKYKCPHCSHEDTYQAVVSKHYDTCPDYLLPCPNKCGESAIRCKDMDAHKEICPQQLQAVRKEVEAKESVNQQLTQSIANLKSKEQSLTDQLECLREELKNVQCLDKQSTHNHDPTYPGVCFFGDPLQESVDSNGRLIQWPQVGVELDIPPRAVPSGEVLYLSIWPCLSGPYVLPPGWELVSPVYLIKTSKFNFKKPVKLSLTHYARLNTDEDCNEMAFVLTRFSPKVIGSKPEYHFEILDHKYQFAKGKNVGIIYVDHFCGLAISRKRSSSAEPDLPSRRHRGSNEYSLLLYHNKPIPYKYHGYAVFAVSLYHPLYLENLDKAIKEQFRGIHFWRFPRHCVQMTGNTVKVKYSTEVGTGWKIEHDTTPEISRDEIDLPKFHHKLSCRKDDYPPRIRLTISAQEGAVDARYSLKVQGISIPGVSGPVEFFMELKRKEQCLPVIEERPTLPMLLALSAREKILNIPELIGTRYTQLGIFLLADDTGTKVKALENQYRDNAEKINIEILSEWICGRGKQPVTWRTLVEVLCLIGLNVLADSIAAVKC